MQRTQQQQQQRLCQRNCWLLLPLCFPAQLLMSRGNLQERKIHPGLTLGRFRGNNTPLQGNRSREVEGPEAIPHDMKWWSSHSSGAGALVSVPAELLGAAGKVVSLGTLVSAAAMLLGSAPDAKRKPK